LFLEYKGWDCYSKIIDYRIFMFITKCGSSLSYINLSAALILLLTLAQHTDPAHAASWQHTVSSQLTTEYNSNPNLTSSNPEAISRVILSPSYALIGQPDDNQTFKVGAALQIVRSSNETLSPSRNSPILSLDWSRQYETGELGLGSQYTENSTRNTDGVDATSSIEGTQASRTFNLRVTKMLTERSTLVTNGEYQSVTFKGGPFIDYSTRSASLMFNYTWSESNVPFVKYSYLGFVPVEGGVTTRLDVAALGLNTKWSDRLDSTVELGQSQDTNKQTGTQSAASLTYQSLNSQFTLKASHQSVPSGINGLVLTDQINAGWSYDLNDQQKVGIDAMWQTSHLIADVTSRTEGVWLQTQLNPLWGLRTYYQQNTVDRGNNNTASSYILGLNLGYTHPDF
jgi:hypothetical protein